MRLRLDDPRRRGRAKLALLALFFLAPVAAAWLAWWLEIVPGATGNYGTLIAPRPLEAPELAALRGRWVLVQIDSGACDAYCERKLYLMRQVRRATGRDMLRVERLWLVSDEVAPSPALKAAIEGTAIVPADPRLLAQFPAEGAASAHIYLVDPLGNLMLRFPHDPDPAKMLKDVQRLLKVSRFG